MKPGTKTTSGRLSNADRAMLLGTLVVILLAFIAAWLGSRGILPGARLFPYTLAGIGFATTVLALGRVWLRQEPREIPGRAAGDGENPLGVYRRALALIVGFAIYFAAIYGLGFMVATAGFVVVFARAHGQTYRYAMSSALAALLAVYVLSSVLELYLPAGLLGDWLTGG